MIVANNDVFNLDDIIIKLKNNGYKKFSEFAKDVIETEDNGKTIDSFIPIFAYNIIKHTDISSFDSNFLKIEVEKFHDYLKIAKDSDGNFIDVHNGGLFSVYNNFDLFPLARVYLYMFKDTKEMMDVLKNKNSLGLDFNSKKLNALLDEQNAKNRIKEHLSELDRRFSKLNRYVQGRIDNTSITSGMVIARKDFVCPICNSEKPSEIENLSATNFELGIQISMEVCKNCLSSSTDKNLLLSMIFEQMDISLVLEKRKLTIEEIREISNKIVEIYLNARISNFASPSNNTITAITNDDYILKLRLTKLDDYGYMILSPKEEELIRFDSAKHHSEKVSFMPHHVHNNVVEEEKIKEEAKLLSKKKAKELKSTKDITDSFLSGFLGIDYIALKKKLDFLQNN